MLDQASLLALFYKLDGPDLARCACVCSSWRAVAYSEALWQQLCRQLEPFQLFREDLWEELGRSYRRYYGWRHPRLHHRVNKLCILDNSGAGQTKLMLAEVVPTAGGGYVARGTSMVTVAPPGSYIGGTASKPTWSPRGGLLAYSCLQPGRMSVVVVDSAGAPVCEVEMDDPPSAAFYLHWAPCGTRLLLLSAWPSGPVALKAWDVGLALLAAEGGVQLRARKPVLLGAARPLFLTCCPSSTRVLWHGGMRDFALVDCATIIDEDGSEHDRVFSNAAAGGARAPQWVQDASGRQWLLLSVLLEGEREGQGQGQGQQGGQGLGGQGEEAEPEGELLLLPVDGLEEAYEMGGSVLSMDLVRSLSTRVCHLGDTDHLSYTANRDCSVVAWAECCRVAVRFMQGSERAFWLELPTRHPHTPVLAMQWAPDGRKLLLLALEGNDWFWCVWYAPSAPPPDDVADAELAGHLGSVLVCTTHQISAAFQTEYLPFFDQFAQCMQLWSPDSAAFCYAALDASHRPSLREMGRESSYAFVQRVPSLEELQAGASEGASEGAGTGSSSGSGVGGSSSSSSRRRRGARFRGGLGGGAGLTVYAAPPPSRIMPGSIACWSYT